MNILFLVDKNSDEKTIVRMVIDTYRANSFVYLDFDES